MNQIKKETISGAKWGILQKLTMQPLQLVYSMVLARLISPSEMGIVGLTAIFFAIADQLANAGFGSALIRKIDRTEDDCNTMFWFNVVMSFLVSSILFLSAPWFASFYNQAELLWLTRASAFNMFMGSLSNVHWTLYQCRRDFKTPAIVGCITSLVGMPVCLYLAWLGWGVWAIMCQGLCTSLLSLSIVWCISPWKPRLLFSCSSFRYLFGFGSKLACSGLIHIVYREITTFIIGKFYSPAQLGYFSRGRHVAALIPQTLSSILGTVTYPILSTLQNDDEVLRRAYQKYIRISTLVIAFGIACVITMATPLIHVMYGATWLPCAIYLQIIALSYSTDHVASINLNLLMVKGRSDLFLRLEIIKKSVSLAMIFYAATISVEAICWAGAIYAQIAIFINTYYTGKLLGLTWWKQQKDYLPYFAQAGVACIPAYLLTTTNMPAIVQLVLGGGCAFILYFGTLHLRREAAYIELYRTLRQNKWCKWLPAI